jgi:hypothetical protein
VKRGAGIYFLTFKKRKNHHKLEEKTNIGVEKVGSE